MNKPIEAKATGGGDEAARAELEREIETLACFAWQALLIDAQTSADLFKAIIARVPERATYWAAYGTALAKLQRAAEAIPVLERAVLLSPKSIDVWCLLGELSIDVHDWPRATAALSRCLELDPGAKHPSGVRARALVKKAEKLLAEATK